MALRASVKVLGHMVGSDRVDSISRKLDNEQLSGHHRGPSPNFVRPLEKEKSLPEMTDPGKQDPRAGTRK